MKGTISEMTVCWKAGAAFQVPHKTGGVKVVYGSQTYQNTSRGIGGRNVENSGADHNRRGSNVVSIIKQCSSDKSIDGDVWSH